MDIAGTRKSQNMHQGHPSSQRFTRLVSEDKGLLGYVSGVSLTFGSGRITAANGTFAPANWPTGSRVLVGGSNLNNGEFQITGSDGTNSAYLAVDPPPKAETVSATVRYVG